MMSPQQVDQASLLLQFSLERQVPADHLLRTIDRFVDLSVADLRLIQSCWSAAVGWLVLGMRSEWRLCEEPHLNLAYRWFCRLGLDGEVPEQDAERK